MRRIPTLALGLALLLGCDPYDRIRTDVTWDAAAQRFHVHARVENVSKEFFGCHQAPDCAANIAGFLQGKYAGDGAKAVLSLVDQGAMDLRVAVERDGGELDVLLWYDAVPGSFAADRTGVMLEREGPLEGPYVDRLVVRHEEKRHLVSPTRYTRRLTYAPVPPEGEAPPGAGLRAEQSFVLHKKETRVIVVEDSPSGTGVSEPILTAIPGLADALVAQGVTR